MGVFGVKVFGYSNKSGIIWQGLYMIKDTTKRDVMLRFSYVLDTILGSLV